MSITLNSIPGGLYQYSSNSYFPIDEQLLAQSYADGSDPANYHNFHFTSEFHTLFTYSTANLISDESQRAHLASPRGRKMDAPTREVRHGNEPSAVSTWTVDA